MLAHGNQATIATSPPSCRSWAELDAMLKDEASHVRQLRVTDGCAPAVTTEAGRQSNDFFGLALSGGGIRSATFSLGVIQALASCGLLRHVDYLSTVSGGGYVGAWLSACILRGRLEKKESLSAFEARIAPNGAGRREETSPEVRFLRAYSNYLTPRLGLLSGDTLAALAGLACNLVLNLFLGAVSISLIVAAFHWTIALAAYAAQHSFTHGILAILSSAALLISLASVAFFLVLQGHDLRKSPIPNRFILLQAKPRWFALAPLVVSLVAGSAWIASTTAVSFRSGIEMTTLLAFAALSFGAWFASTYLELDRVTRDRELNALVAQIRQEPFSVLGLVARAGFFRTFGVPRILAKIAVAAFMCAGLLYCLAGLAMPTHAHFDLNQTIFMMSFGPALEIAGLWLLIFLWMGVAGNSCSEFTREWLNRYLGELIGFAGVWLSASAIVVYARPGFEWSATILGFYLADRHWELLCGLLASVAFVAFMRRKPATCQSATIATNPSQSRAITFGSFLAALLIFASLTCLYQNALLALLPAPAPPIRQDLTFTAAVVRHFVELTPALSLGAASASLAVLALLALIGFACIDVNAFSIQNIFRNRLVRCYLGAAHRDRLENPYAGFDPNDDFELKQLGAQRPYLLMNAALNITLGQDLAWQQRKAAPFVFSPRWCGFWTSTTAPANVAPDRVERGGYVRTQDYVHEPASFGRQSHGLMVGTAMATSGAAVSSQMGFASRGPLAFILTLTNLRLGRWLPNPARKTMPSLWKRHSPELGALCYLRELFGATNERYDWVYASDGAHFENLGLYELIRRRCARIVCVDAGADPLHTFADLGDAVQKCRVDFGADIRIDTAPLHKAADGTSAKGYAIGTIDYPATPDSAAFRGTLVYIKPSIPAQSTDLPTDILAYRAQHPEFPHQNSRHQWFSEKQFESYRYLGFTLGLSALKGARAALQFSGKEPSSTAGKRDKKPARIASKLVDRAFSKRVA
jgi:hypothetical protein